jgi:hypothetical protein
MESETIAYTFGALLLIVLGAVLVLAPNGRLIRRLVQERDAARTVVNSLTERLATQSDILSRRAEKPPAPWSAWRLRHTTPLADIERVARHCERVAKPLDHVTFIPDGSQAQADADAVARLRAAEPRRENDP